MNGDEHKHSKVGNFLIGIAGGTVLGFLIAGQGLAIILPMIPMRQASPLIELTLGICMLVGAILGGFIFLEDIPPTDS